MFKIYAYIRQSTAEQVRFGYNLEEQERQIRDYCEFNYHDMEYSLTFYIDAGKSGTNMNRPQLKKLLNDSKKNKPNLVVFHNIDRLSRELIDLWSMIKFFNQYDIKLASVIGYIDLSTAYGKGNVLNEGLSAMIESMKISDRTIRALKEGVNQGLYPFPHPPLGYMRKDKKLVLSDNPNDIEAVKYMFNAIASNKFNLLHIRRTLKKDYGIVLYECKIKRIINNRVYTGTMEYKEIVKENYCEPIISEDVYKQAKKNITIKKVNRYKTEYYFKNVVHCSNCDSFMHNTAGTSKTQRLYAYYKCPVCKRTVSQIKLLDKLQPDLNKLAVRLSDDETGLNTMLKDIQYLENKRVSLINELKDDYIDVKTFNELYKDIDDKINDLKTQVINIKSKYDRYDTLSLQNKRFITNNYINRIEIAFNSKSFTANIKENK